LRAIAKGRFRIRVDSVMKLMTRGENWTIESVIMVLGNHRGPTPKEGPSKKHDDLKKKDLLGLKRKPHVKSEGCEGTTNDAAEENDTFRNLLLLSAWM
jgi:hypothetical protein